MSTKVLCRSLSSIHILYNQALVGGLSDSFDPATRIGMFYCPRGSFLREGSKSPGHVYVRPHFDLCNLRSERSSIGIVEASSNVATDLWYALMNNLKTARRYLAHGQPAPSRAHDHLRAGLQVEGPVQLPCTNPSMAAQAAWQKHSPHRGECVRLSASAQLQRTAELCCPQVSSARAGLERQP